MNQYTLHIGIWATGVPFTGLTPRLQSLGGAESSCVYVAEALARRGHTVSVFTMADSEVYGNESIVEHEDVTYYAIPEHLNRLAWYDFDVFLVSRDFNKLTELRRLKTKLLGLWNHDVLINPDPFVETLWKPDFIWCLSAFHKRQFVAKCKDHLDLTP